MVTGPGSEISRQALGKGAAEAPISDRPPGMKEEPVQTPPLPHPGICAEVRVYREQEGATQVQWNLQGKPQTREQGGPWGPGFAAWVPGLQDLATEVSPGVAGHEGSS